MAMTEIFNRTAMKERRRTLRRNMTSAEIHVWTRLRKKQIDGHRFRRQFSVGSYVVDFYCPELRLAIEIDGASHDNPTAQEYDRNREEQLCQLGLTILRFRNSEVEKHMSDVLGKILETTKQLKPNRATTFSPYRGKTQKGSTPRAKNTQ